MRMWLKRWWRMLFPIAAPPSSSAPGNMGRKVMAKRNEWSGLGGEEIARRLYWETRTFITDHIHHQGENSIGEDDQSRTFELDKIYRQHQECDQAGKIPSGPPSRLLSFIPLARPVWLLGRPFL